MREKERERGEVSDQTNGRRHFRNVNFDCRCDFFEESLWMETWNVREWRGIRIASTMQY